MLYTCTAPDLWDCVRVCPLVDEHFCNVLMFRRYCNVKWCVELCKRYKFLFSLHRLLLTLVFIAVLTKLFGFVQFKLAPWERASFTAAKLPLSHANQSFVFWVSICIQSHWKKLKSGENYKTSRLCLYTVVHLIITLYNKVLARWSLLTHNVSFLART